MDWLADKWIFLLMFSGYTAILIRHAIEGNKETRNVTDYFIGGRSLGGITIGLSFFATAVHLPIDEKPLPRLATT